LLPNTSPARSCGSPALVYWALKSPLPGDFAIARGSFQLATGPFLSFVLKKAWSELEEGWGALPRAATREHPAIRAARALRCSAKENTSPPTFRETLLRIPSSPDAL